MDEAEKRKILRQLRAVARRRKELDRKRDSLILLAIEGDVPREKIADALELSEQRIYQLRRAELARRAAEGRSDLPQD